MTTFKEVKDQAAQLKQKLEELKGEFVDQASAMREIAAGMEEFGTAPEVRFLSSMQSLHSAFENRRQQVLDFAQMCGGGDSKDPTAAIYSIDDLQVYLDSAVEVYWQNECEKLMVPLRKAASFTKKGDVSVSSLDDFKARAKEMIEQLDSCEQEDFEGEVEKIKPTLEAFSAVVDLVEQLDILDDEQCEELRQTTVGVFDSSLVIAVLRGHVTMKGARRLPNFLIWTKKIKEKIKNLERSKKRKPPLRLFRKLKRLLRK